MMARSRAKHPQWRTLRSREVEPGCGEEATEEAWPVLHPFPHPGMANLDREPQTILPSSPSVGRQLRAAGGAGQSRTIDREPFPNEGNADPNRVGYVAHSAGVDR